MTCALLAASAGAQNAPQLGVNPVEEIIQAMTLDEKVSLLVGTGMPGFGGNSAVVGETQDIVPGAAGTTYPIPRLGIPAIVVADGPAGLRISSTRADDPQTYYCTAFPIATLIASTWDTELANKIGQAMGNETLEYGVDVILGPALNIHRNPLGGRNYEYYSEDPYISGSMASAVVKGIQSNGVGTSIKHFAVNSQESKRTDNDARLTPRALREIYLKGFQMAVEESDPWTVMSSYNYINGEYASESYDLLTTILRDEWGFNHIVMTDWFGGKNAPAQIHAGNDLLMPGRPDQKQAIINAVNNKTLNESDVDLCVKRMLDLIVLTPRFKNYQFSNQPDLNAHAAIARQSAAEGMILLTNKNETLPLSEAVRNVAAFGTTSYDFISGGTGSGKVNNAYTVSLVEGLQNAGYQLDEEIVSLYQQYIQQENAKLPRNENPMMDMLTDFSIPEFQPSSDLIARKAKETDLALITIGRSTGEFKDRKSAGGFYLTPAEKSMIENVAAAYQQQGKRVVVILNIGGVIETDSWKDLPDAILLAWQGGQEGGNSVADILKGDVNPSGKLTMTFPLDYTDDPSSSNFPVDYEFNPADLM